MASKEKVREALDGYAKDDVSEKQQNFIASLVSQTEIDREELERIIKDKSDGELSYTRKQASRVIEHLIELRDSKKKDNPVKERAFTNTNPSPLELSPEAKKGADAMEAKIAEEESPPF